MSREIFIRVIKDGKFATIPIHTFTYKSLIIERAFKVAGRIVFVGTKSKKLYTTEMYGPRNVPICNPLIPEWAEFFRKLSIITRQDFEETLKKNKEEKQRRMNSSDVIEFEGLAERLKITLTKAQKKKLEALA